ncbi:MAG: protein kinase [Victivallaceae bacterium]|nr:protein kinase [Victivallaceae bacterium]
MKKLADFWENGEAEVNLDSVAFHSAEHAFCRDFHGAEQRTVASDGVRLPNARLLYLNLEALSDPSAPGLCANATDRWLGRRTGFVSDAAGKEESEEGKAAATEAFFRRIRKISQIGHPGIPPIYQLCGDEQGRALAAVGIPSGRTLRSYLDKLIAIYGTVPDSLLRQSEKHSLRRRMQIFQMVGSTLAAAHEHEVLHGDVRPENIMLGAHGAVWLCNWHLATILPSASQSESGKIRIASYEYTAPEVLNERRRDVRSEGYSLGILLYELLTLASPFDRSAGKELEERVKCHRVRKFRHAFGCRLDRRLVRIAKKAMAFDSNDRFATAEQVVKAVENELSGEANRFRRRFEKILRIAIVTLLFATILSGTFYGGRILREIGKSNSQQFLPSSARRRADVMRIAGEAGSERRGALDRALERMEHQCAFLAGVVSARLDLPCPKEDRPSGPLWHPGGSSCAGAQAPPGFGPAPACGRPLSFELPSVWLPTGSAEEQEIAGRLSGATQAFWTTVADSLSDGEERPSEREKLKRYLAAVTPPRITRIFVTLDNGIVLTYPCEENAIASPPSYFAEGERFFVWNGRWFCRQALPGGKGCLSFEFQPALLLAGGTSNRRISAAWIDGQGNTLATLTKSADPLPDKVVQELSSRRKGMLFHRTDKPGIVMLCFAEPQEQIGCIYAEAQEMDESLEKCDKEKSR